MSLFFVSKFSAEESTFDLFINPIEDLLGYAEIFYLLFGEEILLGLLVPVILPFHGAKDDLLSLDRPSIDDCEGMLS